MPFDSKQNSLKQETSLPRVGGGEGEPLLSNI